MFDIVALGESLIDFTPSGKTARGWRCLRATGRRASPMCWQWPQSWAAKPHLSARWGRRFRRVFEKRRWRMLVWTCAVCV